MVLNVSLHLFPGCHEVVVALVHLVVPLRSRRVRDAASELVGEFGDEVVVDAVLQRAQDDDGSRVRHLNLLHRFVRKHRFFLKASGITFGWRHGGWFLIGSILRLIFAAFNKREFTAEGEVLLLPFQSRLLLDNGQTKLFVSCLFFFVFFVFLL